jgi:DNA-binding IclR family transcriptional regulator
MVATPVGPESPEARRVLDAVPWRPVSLNQVVERCGLPVSVVVVALDELEAGGVVSPSGAFWHRVGPA